MLLGEGNRPQVFKFEQLANSADFPGVTVERITRLLDWLGRDYAGLRAAAEDKRALPQKGFEPYNLNPLVQFPIVRLPDGQSVVPIARYLYRRVTTGLFYDLIRSNDQSRVANVIGRAVELYARRLIRDLPTHGRIVGETEYGKQKATSEWMLVEKDAVVIIECKRASLLQKAKTTGNVADLQNDLARRHSVADGIKQMLQTREAIRRGEVPGVPRDRPVVGLLLTMDTFFLANTEYVRQIVARVLAAKGVELGDFQYQLGSIADLDAVCSLLMTTKEKMSTMLLRKMSSAESSEVDLQQWANNQPPSESRMPLPSHRRAEEQATSRWAEAYGTSKLVRRLRPTRRPR